METEKTLNYQERKEILGIEICTIGNRKGLSFRNSGCKVINILIKMPKSDNEWNYKFVLEPKETSLPLDYGTKTATKVIKDMMVIR